MGRAVKTFGMSSDIRHRDAEVQLRQIQTVFDGWYAVQWWLTMDSDTQVAKIKLRDMVQ